MTSGVVRGLRPGTQRTSLVRASLVFVVPLLALAGCSNATGAPLPIDFAGVRLVPSSASFTPVGGRTSLSATLVNGAADTVAIASCGDHPAPTLERWTGAGWSRVDAVYCLDIYPQVRQVPPGDTAVFAAAWPDTISGRYRLTLDVTARRTSRTATIHSHDFTIQ